MARRTRTQTLTIGLAVALGLGLGVVASEPAAAASRMACEDPSHLCVSGGGKFEPDVQTGPKDKKKRVEKAGSTLSLEVEGGRGSLFVNGRYAGTAPMSSISVPAGRNDVQVRDGSTVLAGGVLTVPKGASLSVTVKHP